MEQERHQEIRGLFQILEQTSKIAEDSILTENYKDSESRCISQFNKVLHRLNEINNVPEGLFDPLQENATFSEISIACNHLAAYLSEGLGITSDLKSMMTNILGKNIIENISEEFKESGIGELIRSAMPDFLTETVLDDINRSFKTSSDGSLLLDTDIGNIYIQGADTEDVNVVVHRAAQMKTDRHAAEFIKAFNVSFNQQDTELHIEAKFSEGKRYWTIANIRLDILFFITVPKSFRSVIIKSAGGDVTVQNLNGSIQCRTNSGQLNFENITGPILSHTDNGNIRLTNCNGDVRVDTLRGNIEINDIVGRVDTTSFGGNIRANNVIGAITTETSGGNIKIENCKGGVTAETAGGSIDLENDGPIAAKTFGGSINADITGHLQEDSFLESPGGDITVSMLSDMLVKIDAKCNGGEVTSELPVDLFDQNSQTNWHIQRVINGEGPLLKLRSIGGDIILKSLNES